MTTTTSGRRARHLLAVPDDDLAMRLLGPDGPPSLTLRLPGDVPPPGLELLHGDPSAWGGEPDPLAGNELWRAVSATTVLAGLRDTAITAELLEILGYGRLNGLRFRMSTARPASSRRDRRTDLGRTFGTVCALSTLLCWPGHARGELTSGASRAATEALQQPGVARHPGAALALRWVVALAAAFPGDPMALAPLLLKLRWFEAGQDFLVPARWPSALLSGDAVAVSGSGSTQVGAGLGAVAPDAVAFVANLEQRTGEPAALPSDDALRRALALVGRLVPAPTGTRPERPERPGRRDEAGPPA
jgi:hypothetical protein